MTSPHNSQTSPGPKTNHPFSRSPISKHPFVTCHIGCQPQPPSYPKRQPPRAGPLRPHQPPNPHPLGRGRKGPEHAPPPRQLRLRTQNTSYLSTIRDLARRSETPRSTPSSSPTPSKPASSEEGGTTLPPSRPATSTPTTCSPPPTRKLPQDPDQVARARTKLRSLLPLNKLRAWLPPQIRRGLHPSQVPNDASLLLARPLPPTLTPPQLPPLSQTSLLAYFANPTAPSPSVFLPR